MVKVVSFNNKANKLAGHLHLPENFSEDFNPVELLAENGMSVEKLTAYIKENVN